MIDLPIMRNHQSPPPSPPPDSILKRDALIAQVSRGPGSDLVNIGKRAGEMLAQAPLCVLGLVIADCPEDQAMVPKDGCSLARCRKMEPAQPIKMTALPPNEHP